MSVILSGSKYSSQRRGDEFAVTIVTADFYCAPPTCLDVRYSDFRGAEVKKVPVIRIFGSTPAGQKVCLHVHGVFPYLDIPYDGCVSLNKMCISVWRNLNRALNASMGCADSTNQHIHQVSAVTGIPFYGYHEEECTFLRIVYYNPAMLSRICELVQNGCIAGMVFQPHNAHVPFILQFFIDYNLYGMNQIRLSSVRFRRNAVGDLSSSSPLLSDSTFTTPKMNESRIEGIVDVSRLPRSKIMPECEKVSTCALEADASAIHILNNLELRSSAPRDAGNPGIEFIWADERCRRADAGKVVPLTPPGSPPRSQIATCDSHEFYLGRLKSRLQEVSETSSDEALPGYPLNASLQNVDAKSASSVEIFAPRCIDDISSVLSQSDIDFADLLAHLDESGTSQKVSPEEDLIEDYDAATQVEREEDTIIETGTPKPTPEQEAQDAIETFEMSQAWDLGDDLASSVLSPNSPAEDDRIPQVDGLTEDSPPSRKRRRYGELRRKFRPRAPTPQHRTCYVSVEKLRSTAAARKVCSGHNVNFVGDFPEVHSLLEEQELSYFSRTLRSGSEPGKIVKVASTRETVSEPEQKLIRPCSVVLECLKAEPEPERTNGDVDAVTDEDDVDFVESSQVATYSTKRWPLRYSNNFRSFYQYGSPTLNASDLADSSSPVDSPKRETTSPELPFLLESSPDSSRRSPTPEIQLSMGETEVLVPFQNPPRRKDFSGYVKNKEPFWSNVDDYFEAGEGNKARIGTGDLAPVLCYVPAALEPFAGTFDALEAAKVESLVERGILEDSGTDLVDNPELLVALQQPGSVILTPVDLPPARGRFVKKKIVKIQPGPVTSTPFVSNSAKTVDEIPISRSSMGTPSMTPVPEKTPQQPKCKRELMRKRTSQIAGPTPERTFNYKVNHGNLDEAKAQIEADYLTVMSLELFMATRGDLNPDPAQDSILAAFYYVSHDVMPSSDLASGKQTVLGAIVVSQDPSKEWELNRNFFKADLEVVFVSSEAVLIDSVVDLVRLWDPDILLGFEVQQLSWGYLIERAEALGNSLPAKLSRIPSEEKASHAKEEMDPYGSSHTSEIHLCGRIALNVWRLFRHEIALTSYTYENLFYHVHHERVPKFSCRTLFEWWTGSNKVSVVKYFSRRVEGNLTLLEKMDLIGRTCELARLFGIQFYEVLSRGSQFRVESMMLRLAKPANYVPVSPSVEQRAQMRAPECIPLIMEPGSTFYVDPVVVLDFQSLYPSVIIGYNYCYSTCLGRADLTGQIHPFKFGCTTLRVPPETIAKLGSNMTISPCGVAFVTADVRRGILPKMLDQILTTRIMVKQSMKMHSGDKALQRVLDARQLGLKLIANVTYGYTSANFSGRMSCVEIADSVVSKGRETLEAAIRMVHSNTQWNAKVVYGDTDSMFILLPGRDKETAFKIGQEIATAVTKANPKPVKLKFEKVYYPCILQTKKRYVGLKYESVDQKEPEYEAKGIETVRRDGVPAVVKILEKTLRLLFDTKDLSVVKRYVQAQMSRILLGRVNVADLTFAKEFRGMDGYKPGACVPALELARRRARADARAVPRIGDRVPYVVVYGPPGVPLIRLVREPWDVVADPTLRLNAHYYVTKVVVPPLERCLNMLQGVNVMSWYSSLPKIYKSWCQGAPEGVSGPGASTITQFFASSSCPVCDAPTSSLVGEVTLCYRCLSDPQMSVLALTNKAKAAQKRLHDINQICRTCCGMVTDEVKCESLDCPLLHFRELWKKDQAKVGTLGGLLGNFSTSW